MRSDGASTDKALRMAIEPEECALHVLDGVARNKAIIPVTRYAKLTWALNRYIPRLVYAGNRRMAEDLHKQRIGADRQ